MLLHMIASVDPSLPVLFLDTGKHFPETLAYRDTLVERLGLTNLILLPVAISASSVAYASTRIENMFMDLGSAAGVAVAQLLERADSGSSAGSWRRNNTRGNLECLVCLCPRQPGPGAYYYYTGCPK